MKWMKKAEKIDFSKLNNNLNNNSNFTEDSRELESAVEGILFASGEPVHIERFCTALEIEREQAEKILRRLRDYYAFERRGMRLLRMEDKWQLCSAPDYADVIRKAFEIRKPAKLSQPALEALTIIAYYQPTTRAYVDKLRGVDSAYTVKLLEERGLIEACGRLAVPGRPVLYRTTEQFLRSFHIDSLADLPPLPEGAGFAPPSGELPEGVELAPENRAGESPEDSEPASDSNSGELSANTETAPENNAGKSPESDIKPDFRILSDFKPGIKPERIEKRKRRRPDRKKVRKRRERMRRVKNKRRGRRVRLRNTRNKLCNHQKADADGESPGGLDNDYNIDGADGDYVKREILDGADGDDIEREILDEPENDDLNNLNNNLTGEISRVNNATEMNGRRIRKSAGRCLKCLLRGYWVSWPFWFVGF